LALNAGKIADQTHNFPATQGRREIMRDFIRLIIGFTVITIANSFIGCSKGTYSQTDKKSNLKSILSQLHGDFTWRMGWIFITTFESYKHRRKNFVPNKKTGQNSRVPGHKDHVHLSVN
jgi:hypothetical protein